MTWNEGALIEEYEQTPRFGLAWVQFALFGLGVSEWQAPSEAWNGFWNAFGNIGVMQPLVFSR